MLLVLPVEVDEVNTRISLKDGARSSCWATRGILAFCGEREHGVSVYDLAVRPKLEARMIYMRRIARKEESGVHTASALIKTFSEGD